MKKIFVAVVVCFGLIACTDDRGSAFVGVWKNQDKSSQTMIITKVDDGYRVEAKFDDPQWSSMNLDMKLKADSDKSLVTADGQKQVLEMGSDGQVISRLYNSPKTFTKAD